MLSYSSILNRVTRWLKTSIFGIESVSLYPNSAGASGSAEKMVTSSVVRGLGPVSTSSITSGP
jgi:hypothetical protein